MGANTYQLLPDEGQPIKQSGTAAYSQYEYDVELAQGGDWEWYKDVNIRLGFIRKVYSILGLQLLGTFTCTLTVINIEPLHRFFSVPLSGAAIAVFWGCFILSIVMLFTIACNPSIARKYPSNYIFLAAFTAVESVLVSMISVQYETSSVYLALLMTMAVAGALTAYASQTKRDFTQCGGMLLALLVVLLVFGIITIFIRVPIVHTIYAALGALLFSFYIVHDTQLIIGGRHRKYQFSPDEYVFAALALYLDIVNLFLYLLHLIGGGGK